MTLDVLDPTTNQKELKSAVGTALRHWHTVGGTDESLLSDLLLVQQERQRHDDASPSTLRLATNTILQAALAELEKENEEGVRILRLRFQDDEQIKAVAFKLNLSEFTISHKQREAIDLVAGLLAEQEAAAWQQRVEVMEARLPPPSYTKLFGVAEPQALLVAKLLAEAEPQITAVVGIGGIGKTSLARAVTSEVIKQFRFADAVWVHLESASMSGRFTSPEQLRDTLLAVVSDHLWPEQAGESTPRGRLLQVRQALKQRPILVIVDNLESAEDTANLLDYLQDLAGPSKFLLTSRTRPAGVFHVSLDQLSLAAATELVRYRLRNGNIAGAETLTDEDIAAIYERTGGNPLALILVVNLLDCLALSHILDGLMSVNIAKVEDLYRHVYWQNWQTISEDARRLLQAMVLVAREGGKLDYLQAISGLGERPLQSAVTELRYRSLLEVGGDVHTKRYSIHPLTRSFLQTEIIHWPSGTPPEPPLPAA
jgi:hypothetical protein